MSVAGGGAASGSRRCGSRRCSHQRVHALVCKRGVLLVLVVVVVQERLHVGLDGRPLHQLLVHARRPQLADVQAKGGEQVACKALHPGGATASTHRHTVPHRHKWHPVTVAHTGTRSDTPWLHTITSIQQRQKWGREAAHSLHGGCQVFECGVQCRYWRQLAVTVFTDGVKGLLDASLVRSKRYRRF